MNLLVKISTNNHNKPISNFQIRTTWSWFSFRNT